MHDESDDEDRDEDPSGNETAWLQGGRGPRGPSNGANAQIARLPLGGSPALRELDALLEAGPAAVRALSSVALHRMLTEIGLHDALELLELADPEQVREVFDLQVWQHDRIDHDELLDWAHALTLLPDDARAAMLHGLDVELLGFLLQSKCRIYLTQDEDEPLPEEPEGTFYSTPDGWFAIDILEETEAAVQQLIAVIEALYQADQDDARRLLQDLMWELSSQLEEASLRWRLGRLQDLGFPDPLESLLVYARLDPKSVRPDEGSQDQPLRADPQPIGTADAQALAPRGDDGTFWARAVLLLDDAAERERLAQAMMFLANRTLAADHVGAEDTSAATESLQQLRGRLSIGLEHLCAGHLDRAPQVLQQVALLRIARLGYSLIVDVGRPLLPLARAGRLGRKPRQLDLLEPPLAQRLGLLLAPRPRFADDPRFAERAAPRPFQSAGDLDTARGWVDEARLCAELVPPSSWPSPAAELQHDLDLPTIFRSRTVEALLGRTAPFDGAGLSALLAHLDRERQAFDAALEAAAARELASVLGAAHPQRAAAQALVAGWFGQLAETLAALDLQQTPPDTRFIAGLWLRRSAP